jgi:hypothetical protein
MSPCRILLLCLLLILNLSSFAQDPPASGDSLLAKSTKTTLKGYLSDLFSPQYNNVDNQWKVANYLHQRLNFGWTPSTRFTFSAQLRTRYIYNQAGRDTSFVNIQDGVVWQKNKSYFNTTLDRLNLKYTKDKLEVTIGRQRINWGQSFVWNPNDLFNSYSFFDFDYIERPGSDAIRLQYYNTFTSSTELAAKIDRYNKVTVAGLYRFNRSGIDFQLLGGLLSSEEVVVGAGWTGSIKSLSLFGEGSLFRPVKNFASNGGMAMIDVGCSKIFANNLSLQLEGLYVSKKPDINSMITLFQSTLDVRRIAFAQVNLFGSLSYPITPLINGSLAVMWFPGTGGVSGIYTGPSLDVSLGNNLNLSVIAQYFKGDFPNAVQVQNAVLDQLKKQTLMFSFVRLKWNF